MKDSATGLSKGYAFCEYVDINVTDQVSPEAVPGGQGRVGAGSSRLSPCAFLFSPPVPAVGSWGSGGGAERLR